MGKVNIIERAQRCSTYTQIFFGYVKGRHFNDPHAPINTLADEFIEAYDLYDILDPKVMQVSYINFTKIYIDLKRHDNTKKNG